MSKERQMYYITDEQSRLENIGSDLNIEQLQTKLTPRKILSTIQALRKVRKEISEQKRGNLNQ